MASLRSQTPNGPEDEEFMVRESRFPFAETVDRLTTAITGGGATIFDTIDQSAAARGVGLTLRPTTLIVFGNPKGGTPLMESAPLFGLELPLKLLVWEEDGIVSVAYVSMFEVAQRYGLAADDPRIIALDRALDAVSGSVV